MVDLVKGHQVLETLLAVHYFAALRRGFPRSRAGLWSGERPCLLHDGRS